MEIKTVKIGKLKENEINPKKHYDEGIEESINDLGYLDPIEVDEKFVILAGHGRLRALKKAGYKEVAVIVHKGLTEEQKRRYLLANNQLSMREGWDERLLKEYFEIEELLNAGFGEQHL